MTIAFRQFMHGLGTARNVTHFEAGLQEALHVGPQFQGQVDQQRCENLAGHLLSRCDSDALHFVPVGFDLHATRIGEAYLVAQPV
jgi:hypothetical protein